MTTQRFDIGDRVRLRAEFRNLEGFVADPTSVTLAVLGPGDVASQAISTTKDATGVYHGDVEPDAAGTWSYRFAGTGAMVAAEEGTFIVRTRVVPAP